MNNYATLNSVGQSAKRIKILHDGWRAMRVQPRQIHRFPTRQVKQYGVSLRAWNFVAKIDNTPASNYASLTEVEAWFTATTNNGNTLTFIDPMGTSYSVVIANDYDPQTLTPMVDGAVNAHYVPFVLEQIS